MGYHYIPRRLLRGFTEHGGVWTFDKRTSEEPRHLTSGTIANEKRMYPEPMEVRLGSEFEEPFNAVLARIDAGEELAELDRLAIGRYVLTMYRRGPGARARARSAIPSVAALVARRQFHRLPASEQTTLTSAHSSRLQERAREVEQAIRDEGEDSLWLTTMFPEGLPKVDRALQAMKWAVWRSPPGQQFVIGDCPVVFPEELGLADNRSTVVLPVSDKLALLGSWIAVSASERRTLSKQQVRALNVSQAQQAHRWVFFKKPEPWVLPFLRRQTGSA